MPIVIPKWTAHGVADWNELYVDVGDGLFDLNEASAALLNYMPLIGITALTQETVGDAWCRIAIHQALLGSFLTNSETGQPVFLTKFDVLRHIGVETEGKQQSFLEFCNSIYRQAQQQDGALLPSFVANGGCSLLNLLALSGNEESSGPNR